MTRDELEKKVESLRACHTTKQSALMILDWLEDDSLESLRFSAWEDLTVTFAAVISENELLCGHINKEGGTSLSIGSIDFNIPYGGGISKDKRRWRK